MPEPVLIVLNGASSAGKTLAAQALITRMGADTVLTGLDEVLEHYFGPLGIPVAHGLPIGHIDDQWTLPLGARARFDAEAGTVELVEAGVR